MTLAAWTALGQTAAPFARLPDGRKIHFYCLGQGSPTVILTAGNTNWSGSWNKVEGALAGHRVCAWDRAGFGLSDPSPEPQDALHTTADLEKALRAAKVAPPYIMVSQSAGAYESLLFTDRHPGWVVGLVMVDPSIPDQPQRFTAAAPAYQAAVGQAQDKQMAAFQACAAEPHPTSDLCQTFAADLPPDARALVTGNPARIATEISRLEQFDNSAREVVRPGRSYGDLPIIVLTAENVAMPAGLPPETGPALNAEWRRAHDELAALSARGVNRIVTTSHAIPVERADAVIAAVGQVAAMARAPH